MRRRITVFGGSGFIGRHLVKRLAAAGSEIRIAVRDIESAQFLKPAGDIGQIVLWQTDINDPEQVKTAVAGADAVINLVGTLIDSGGNSYAGIHIDGAKNIAAAARAGGVRQMVHISAIGADKFGASNYARTKALGEKAVQTEFPTVTILRPGIVFGPEDNFFNRFAGLTRILPFLPVFGCPLIPKITFGNENGLTIRVDLYGEGGSRFQPVYVGDVADAIVASLASPLTAGQVYELGGPTVYSYKQLMELVLRYTGRQKWLAPTPYAFATIGAFFLQLLPKPMMTCDQVTLLKSDNVVTDGHQTLASLGIDPIAAEVILPTYLSRFRTAGVRHLQES